MKGLLFAIGMLFITFTQVYAQLPKLLKENGSAKMIVDGKPFLIMGGELHNSTGSDKAALPEVMKEMKSLHLNTVLAYAYWEDIEPVEGKFDFDLIDATIKAAENEGLKLILVWFGSWKSTSSSYAPAWVKKDPKRFPRYILQDGSTLEMLSAFSEENRNADAKAYVALMKHLSEYDKKHTVIMTQVENEPGCFNSFRDHHPAAIKAWQSPMPTEMVSYLKNNKGNLFPELEKVWAENGYKTEGTWEDILGISKAEGDYTYYTEELFMAYHYSKFIDYIAAAGKKERDLPAFCNGWLYNNRGFYPRGTVNPHVLDAYRAAGNALDFYSPNVYTLEYDRLFGEYTLAGNIFFIPESMFSPSAALYSIGAFNSLGFAPFGIDGENVKAPQNEKNLRLLKEIYKTLPNMSNLITSNYHSEKMNAVYIQPNKKVHVLTQGDYKIMASTPKVSGLNPDFGKSLEKRAGSRPATIQSDDVKPAPAPFGVVPEGVGSAIIIEASKDEFYIVGYGVNLHFELKEGIEFEHLGFLSIDEGHFQNEKFIAHKRWNGDEQKLLLPDHKLTTLKVKFYYY